MKPLASIVTALLTVSASACATTSSSFYVEYGVDVDTLRNAYFAAAKAEEANPEAPMFGLGIPLEDALVVWSLPASKEAGVHVAPVFLLDGQLVSQPKAIPLPLAGAVRYEIPVPASQRGRTLDLQIDGRHVPARTRPAATTATPERVSFLAFSCNSPFAQRRDNKALIRVPDELSALYWLMGGRAGGTLTGPALTQRPDFALGLGDQIYVDPDAGHDFEPGQISLFSGERSDNLHVPLGRVDHALETIYRSTFSLPGFVDAMATLPTAMVWDDHEIVDGWGSQGYEDTAEAQQYFYAAKKSFLAFQASRNPHVGGTLWRDVTEPPPAEAFTSFTWGKSLSVFVLDTRSTRRTSSSEPTGLLSKAQRGALQDTLGKLPTGAPAALVLGMPTPISLEADHPWHADITSKLFAQSREAADDARDGWHHSQEDRAWLVDTLVEHFSAQPLHRLVIVSGDIHQSGIYRLHVQDARVERTIGYEIVSSGIGEYLPPEKVRSADEVFSALASIRGSRERIDVTTLGYLQFTPAFAEVEVAFDPSASSPPMVRATFYATLATPENGVGSALLGVPINRSLAAAAKYGRPGAIPVHGTVLLGGPPSQEQGLVVPCDPPIGLAAFLRSATGAGRCIRSELGVGVVWSL